MEEFLRNNYFLITHSLEILAAITGLLLFAKYKRIAAKYFIYFLVYITICELIAKYSYYIDKGQFFHFLKGFR